MKKLLALILVLGMGAIANAAILIDAPAEVNMGDEVAISIVVQGAGASGMTIGSISATGGKILSGAVYAGWVNQAWHSNGAVSDGAITGIAGDKPNFQAPDAPDGSALYSLVWKAPDVEGIVTVSASGVAIFEQNPFGYVTSIAPVDINVVPEPMTMSLLSLGGLALIRRRRA
jgi:hypothetical protein